MRSSIPVLLLLLLGLAHTQLGANASSTAGSEVEGGEGGLPGAWQRSLFGRNSRNLLHRGGFSSAASAPSAVDAVADVGGTFDMIASSLNNNNNNKDNNAGYNGEYTQLYAPFSMEPQQQQQQQQLQQQPQITPLSSSLRQPQTEVYGIVEPLIEDTPCANRACHLSGDCCPTGICVNTYGEGKCVYVFGRQRDLCQRHADCAPGSACMLAPQEGIWRCEAESPVLQDVLIVRPKQPLGSECSSSSDCQVINGMCCQHQRLNHRAAPKLSCGYFRDAFDCVDVAPEHWPSVFQQRRN